MTHLDLSDWEGLFLLSSRTLNICLSRSSIQNRLFLNQLFMIVFVYWRCSKRLRSDIRSSLRRLFSLFPCAFLPLVFHVDLNLFINFHFFFVLTRIYNFIASKNFFLSFLSSFLLFQNFCIDKILNLFQFVFLQLNFLQIL